MKRCVARQAGDAHDAARTCGRFFNCFQGGSGLGPPFRAVCIAARRGARSCDRLWQHSDGSACSPSSSPLARRVVPECRTTPARLAFIPVTEVKAITSAGTPCLVPLGLGSARVDKLTITVDPQHGAVAPRGRTGVIYSPQSDFRGEDAFWLSLDGPSNQNPGAAVVRVGITVE
jgi:hypothetical protein